VHAANLSVEQKTTKRVSDFSLSFAFSFGGKRKTGKAGWLLGVNTNDFFHFITPQMGNKTSLGLKKKSKCNPLSVFFFIS
jgi:hypothetical protein